MRNFRILGASLLLLVAPLAWYAGTASADAAAPTCFGKRATITGSGTITGTTGADVIVGSDDPDTIDGRGGNDRICALDGDDDVQGGRGADHISGGTGADTLVGDVHTTTGDAIGGGRDRIFGGPDNDNIVGDSEAEGLGDAARGGGRDWIDAGPDNDGIIGDSQSFGGNALGAGDDVILGGSGHSDGAFGDSACLADACVVRGDGGDDFIDLEPGRDGDPLPNSGGIIVGDNAFEDNSSVVGIAPGQAFGDGIDFIIGGPDPDFLAGDNIGLDGHANPVASSGAGNDSLYGHSGEDTLFGLGGNDRLGGGAGDDELQGGAGDDRLDGGADTDTCTGNNGSGIPAGTDSLVNCEVFPDVP